MVPSKKSPLPLYAKTETSKANLMAKFMKFFLNHVRDGAKAMDVCVQDPPKSDVDLEGA